MVAELSAALTRPAINCLKTLGLTIEREWHTRCNRPRMGKGLQTFEDIDITAYGDFGHGEASPRPIGILYPGARALMIAVLEDAIRCYLGLVHYDRTNPEILARQAEYWIRLEDWESPFSFDNICEQLGLQHDDTRSTILAWRDVDPEKLEARIRSLHTEASANGKAA